jgi:hypothetical protein
MNYVKGLLQICCKCGRPVVGHLTGPDENCCYVGEASIRLDNAVKLYKAIMGNERYSLIIPMMGIA